MNIEESLLSRHCFDEGRGVGEKSEDALLWDRVVNTPESSDLLSDAPVSFS